MKSIGILADFALCWFRVKPNHNRDRWIIYKQKIRIMKFCIEPSTRSTIENMNEIFKISLKKWKYFKFK